jgi:hypothetical protein
LNTTSRWATTPAPARHARTTRSLLRSRLVRLGVGAAALALTASAAPTADATTPRILVGAVGNATGLSSAIGTHLYYHGYGKLDGKVPTAKYVNMKPNVSWHTVATATSGSATYANIVRWAQTLKSRGETTLFTFHHEPEGATSTSFGNAADFIAAWRRVVTIFRQQGVTNVEYTWQMTSWAFATSPTARNYAAKWYPGDSYVTNVGTDPYNWYNCGPGSGKWEQLSSVMAASTSYARAHGKKLVVGEFASQSDPNRRAQWIRNARSYFVANRDVIRAVFYFQYPDPRHCYWELSSSADLAAMRDMARDTTNFNGG